MKMVLLLRHGKSDWSTAVDDRERPLAKRGRRAARAIGEFLTRAGEAPDAIVASPARRAADTATLAAAAGGGSRRFVRASCCTARKRSARLRSRAPSRTRSTG